MFLVINRYRIVGSCGSLAEGLTEVEGFLEGDDALATLQAFRDMGVNIEGPVNGSVGISPCWFIRSEETSKRT